MRTTVRHGGTIRLVAASLLVVSTRDQVKDHKSVQMT